jgi:hypothetical protein
MDLYTLCTAAHLHMHADHLLILYISKAISGVERVSIFQG